MGWGHLKIFFKNHRARRAHIYMKAFWYNVNSSLFKSWSPGVRRGHNKKNHMYMCLHWKQSSSPQPASQFQSNLVQIILGWKELKIVQKKGQVLFQGDIIIEILKLGGIILKSSQEPWARRAHICMKAFWYNSDSSLFK
jgi:hypothetical protein